MYVKISGRTKKINNFLILFFSVPSSLSLLLSLYFSANMFFALNFAMALVNYDAALPRRYEASLDIPFATFWYGEGDGWRGQLANQIFRHDGDILSSLSHFASAFFPCWEN